ncbi:MAG: hypothetical protein ACI3ZR_08725 [bacterium]
MKEAIINSLADFILGIGSGIGCLLITYFIALYIQKKAQITNVTTKSRIKWMQELRKYLNEYISIVRNESFIADGVINQSVKNRLLNNISKIKLHMNYKNESDKVIIFLLNKIENILFDENKKDKRKYLESYLDFLVLLSRVYLKQEWERVKNETKTGNINNTNEREFYKEIKAEINNFPNYYSFNVVFIIVKNKNIFIEDCIDNKSITFKIYKEVAEEDFMTQREY